jgi:SAM-dependent methyltransferase
MLVDQEPAAFSAYVAAFARWVSPRARVLDVGCGVGTSTRLLRDAGFDAVGVDASARFVPAEDGFLVADFAAGTDLPDDGFAAAGALNVLEHVADPKAFLAEMVRVIAPGGHLVLWSPNLTSPLVGLRIAIDLAAGRTPYLGLERQRDALGLVVRNVVRSGAAALGRDSFAPRAETLASGIVGYDTDAIYWTNAAEVRRELQRLGCQIVRYQGEGRTLVASGLARLLPSFAGQLAIVARVS